MNDKDLAQFIEEHGIQAELVQLNRETPTVEAAATAVGVATDQIGKSILFVVDKHPLLVVSNGESRVGYKPLADYLGINRRQLRLANASQVLAITGYAVGTVPPFGHKTQLHTILETGVMVQEVLFTGGGSIQTLMQIRVKELERVTGARIVSLVD